MMTKVFALSVLGALPSVVHATGSTGDVGGGGVTKGALQIEQRFGYSTAETGGTNDHRFRMRQHIDYGFTDYYALRLVVSQDDRREAHMEHEAITIEHRFQLLDVDDVGFNSGFRIQYDHRDGDKTPHELDLRILNDGTYKQRWDWRNDTTFSHDIGHDSVDGVKLEFRNQLMYALDHSYESVQRLSVGGESLNALGRLNDMDGFAKQEHQLGAVLKVAYKNGVYLQSGYRFGISRESLDGSYRFNIGKNF